LAEQIAQYSVAGKRLIQVQFIDAPHEPEARL
jgi:hypothetical protein